MRTLAKNRIPYWYALFAGTQDVTDESGKSSTPSP